MTSIKTAKSYRRLYLHSKERLGPHVPRDTRKQSPQDVRLSRIFQFTFSSYIHPSSHSRYLPYDCVHRLNPYPKAINAHFLVHTLPGTYSPQNNTHNKADISCAMETCPRHLGALGMGTQCCRGAWQSMVCNRGRGQSDQNLGFGQWGVEIEFNRAY